MMMACVLKRAFKDEYSVNLIKALEVPGNRGVLRSSKSISISGCLIALPKKIRGSFSND